MDRQKQHFHFSTMEMKELKLYENDRHEILNETDYMDVFEDLRKWLEENFEK